MNQKEISELRRRFRADRNAFSRVYGCYVNASREVISTIDEPLGMLPQEEAEQYLGLLKKALSGTLGKNLIDIVFSTRQVVDSEEHRLLSALRDTALKDETVRQTFYQRAIDALDMEGNYLLLVAHDAYDVPYRGEDAADQSETASEVFSYIVCCVCPVRDGRLELSYCPGENEFHNFLPRQLVAAPELGFLFPAFDDRAANIYGALAYTRKPEELHQPFLDAIFHVEPPMSAPEQREAFQTALSDALEGECSLEVVQAVHGRLTERIGQHKESRDPEPLTVTAREVGDILEDCGVGERQVAAFRESCGAQFGEDAPLRPANLIDSKRFAIKSAGITITVPPEESCLVEARVIDGRKYLLIPAGEGIEVNGLPVEV
ncbi:MAG: DUF4317 domain-containing protein [Oscillospiraceae bacterium]|jgi:hypothetical protein|nr:DUF4317 domain-containing protein [Oscillospiraceae bacterium]MCI9587729.1 DUF4317 domain-containing protein [Oscillospiraceae bacterium]